MRATRLSAAVGLVAALLTACTATQTRSSPGLPAHRPSAPAAEHAGDVALVYEDGYGGVSSTAFEERESKVKGLGSECFTWVVNPASMGGVTYEYHLRIPAGNPAALFVGSGRCR